MEGTIPACIFSNFTSMYLLDVSNNSFHGDLPHSLSALNGSLQKLILSNNALKGTIPDDVGTLSHLSWLILNSNRIKGTIPDSICDVGASLTQMTLYETDLTGTRNEMEVF